MALRIGCLMAALLVVAACSTPPQEEPKAIAPTTPAAPAASSEVAARGDVSFVSSPASVRRCDANDGNAIVSLAWNAESAGVAFVTVKVDGKVFAEGNSSGSTATGPWVRDDTVFSLFDSANGALLATLKIPFVDC